MGKRVLFCIWALGMGTVAVAEVRRVPHILPDASSYELERHLQTLKKSPQTRWSDSTTRELALAEHLGTRNHAWLRLINSKRPAEAQLSFTSKNTQNGIPIDTPKEYSAAILTQNLDQLLHELPVVMRVMLQGTDPLTDSLPLPQDEYLAWGRRVDRLYQMSLRWRMMKPWLRELERARRSDIRGHYFFAKMEPQERSRLLSNPADWTSEQRTQLLDWMISLCLNNDLELQRCKQSLTDKIEAGKSLQATYDQWRPAAKKIYEGFFAIPASVRRTDLKFTDPMQLKAPFRTPETPEILAFMRDNVEDEWKWGGWKLTLEFDPLAKTRVRFVAGVTPNVDGLGGNIITMNADQPLSEYDAQWTIRHEYGHTLGFNDCYVEFYDVDRKAIVNYQVDVDNLMCSRQGKIQEIHLEELKRAYLKN